MEKPSFSLTRKALLSLFVILLPVLIAMAYNYWNNKRLLKERVIDDLIVIAEAYEGQVYHFLEMNKRRAADFASDGFIRDELERVVSGGRPDALNTHLSRNKLSLDSSIRAVSVIKRDGRVAASTLASSVGTDVSGRTFFKNAVADVLVTEEVVDGPGGLQVSAPITSRKTGEVIGVLTNFLLISELDRVLSGEFTRELGALTWGKGKGKGKTMEAYLVNADGFFITKSIFVKDAVMKHKVETPPVRSCQGSNEEHSGFYQDYRGVEVAGAAMCMPTLGWTLVVEVDSAEALKGFRDMHRSAVVTGTVVTGLIVFLFALFAVFFRNVISQIGRLSAAAGTIAGGEYDVTIPVRTKDELGTLAMAFNEMAAGINARNRALAERERELSEAQSIAHLGSWSWDIPEDRLLWSDESYRIFGLDPRERGLTYDAFMDFVHPEDRTMVEAAVKDSLESGKPYSIEHRIIRPEGVERVVHEKAEVTLDESARPVRMVGTVIDVTDSKAVEKKIEDLARFTSENPYPVLRVSTDGEVLYSNASGEPVLVELDTKVGGVLPQDWIENCQLVQRTQRSMEVELEVRERVFSLLLTPVEGKEYINVYGLEITQRKHDTLELKKLTAAIEQSVNLVFITDINGTIEYVNPTFEEVTGFTKEEAVGQSPNILSSGEVVDSVYEELWKTILAGKTWRGTYRNKRKQGGYYWCNTVISPIKNEAGEITHFLSVQEDVTKQMRSEERIQYLAQHDELTGLINRSRFIEMMDEWIAEAKTSRATGALLLIDIDQFKFLNDFHGHGSGDEFLRRTSKLLLTTARLIYREHSAEDKGLIVARLSGDEFLVFLPHVDATAAMQTAEGLRAAVEGFRFPDMEGSLTISTGVVHYPEHGNETKELLARADAAMYRAKELGRNRVHAYRPEDRDLEVLHSRLAWKDRIIKALAEDRFVPWFQPILDIKENRVTHYEALARLIDKDGSVLLPGSFIDIAERFGLVGSIDRMIIEKVLRLMSSKKVCDRSLSFSANLSGKDLGDEDFLAFLKEKIAETGAGSSCLIFEITETEAIADLDRARDFIKALKAIGCRFSLDDFGVGYTSFTYLKELSVDYIKIDGSFIKNLDENSEDQVFVKAMTDVATVLGIKTVAEFVEREEALDLLRDFGVTYAQGYFIGKPAPEIL